ncbi:hypothetical protein [Neisseria iguanae]|nr:hypothetical protein [Neisseria iguanae]
MENFSKFFQGKFRGILGFLQRPQVGFNITLPHFTEIYWEDIKEGGT